MISSPPDTPHSGARLSIIIPARDEEQLIGRCIESIRLSAAQVSPTPPSLEIIVVLNRCTDRTEEVALRAGARCIREEAKNLSAIRNAGARASTGEIIITIDADSRMSKNMIPKILGALKNPKIVGGGVGMLPERWSLGIFLTGLCLLPIALRHLISGGVFFTRREDYFKIGGFDESLYSVEDIDFAKRLRSYGKNTGRAFAVLWNTYIITSCRKFDHFGDWYFLKNPSKFMTILTGRNQAVANEVWYDFPRDYSVRTSDKNLLRERDQ